MKLAALAAVSTVLVTGASIAGIDLQEKSNKTLADYLNDKNVSFLIVNTGPNARLTTFGWQDANKSCKTIRNAGFNVTKVRNYAAETRAETSADC